MGKVEEEGFPPGEPCADAQERSHPMPWEVEKGPVRLLCDEIGFLWDRRLERQDVFVAFVRQLIEEVDHQRFMQVHVGQMGGAAPSESSATVLNLARTMLAQTTREALIAAAEKVHAASWELNPEEVVPTDHLIDMLSSCASAIRFGLDDPPYRSRHAASAAQHVWKQIYGVSRFDSATPAWEKDWARQKLTLALISLLPAAPDGASLRATKVGSGMNNSSSSESPQ